MISTICKLALIDMNHGRSTCLFQVLYMYIKFCNTAPSTCNLEAKNLLMLIVLILVLYRMQKLLVSIHESGLSYECTCRYEMVYRKPGISTTSIVQVSCIFTQYCASFLHFSVHSQKYYSTVTVHVVALQHKLICTKFSVL